MTRRFPFDTKAPIGFLAAIVLQCFMTSSLMIIFKRFLMFGLATLPLLFPLTDDIKCDLKAIEESLRDKTKRSKMAKPLSQFVQFHSDTRQLRLEISELLSSDCSLAICWWSFFYFQIDTWFFRFLALRINAVLFEFCEWNMHWIAIIRNGNGDFTLLYWSRFQRSTSEYTFDLVLLSIRMPALTRWKL